jgi:HEAT repeat protein
MYMAAGCTEAFEEVLRECERDESDHRMLSLPLRAVAYGGTAIEAVAQRYAARLMDLLVARFQQPSGVFGEEEVRLSECARRALRVVRGHLSSWAGTQLRALATAQGSLGNEARILAWSARVLPPGRPVEDDLHRAQAIVEALVDSGGDPRELTYFLRGCSGEVRAAAVRELVAERSSDHLERARGWLLDDDPNVVATAVRFLADDDASRPAIRSLLDGSTAPLVLSALAADLDVRPRLRSYMVSGPPFVRAAAARALADDPLSEVPIAHLLMGGPDELQASVEVLARKEGGRLLLAPVLRKLLQPRSEGWPGRRAGSSLASRYLRGLEEFTVHLCSLADDKDAEIRAEIAYMLEGLPAAAHVLHRHLSDADPRVRSSAVRSLASDPDARKLIEKCLFDPNTLVVSEAVAALERPSADQLAILKTMLRHSTDSGVRRAILSALTATQEGREHLARLFHEGDSAFRKEALAGIPAGNLWEELISMGLHDNSADVRAACLGALALRR